MKLRRQALQPACFSFWSEKAEQSAQEIRLFSKEKQGYLDAVQKINNPYYADTRPRYILKAVKNAGWYLLKCWKTGVKMQAKCAKTAIGVEKVAVKGG